MNLELQPFHIVAYSNGKNFRMLVEQVVLNDQYERFCISAGGRSVIIQSDRPSVRESKSKRKIKWQLYRGEYNNAEALAWTIKEIEKVVLMKEEDSKRIP